MTAYYNEIDPYAAQWLRNLIAAGHIAPGIVDERSIEDVTPYDLKEFTQCHFFAGIGVWSYALRRAGWADDRPIWTGSCPCQPFSSAGKGAGFADERHLWPAFNHLIRECRPTTVIGEQVASKDSEPWLDLVQADLEALGYAFGAIPFPSAGIGAPHIRDRLYWVANNEREGLEGRGRAQRGEQRSHGQVDALCASDGLADTDGGESGRRPSETSGTRQEIRVWPNANTPDGRRLGGMADTGREFGGRWPRTGQFDGDQAALGKQGTSDDKSRSAVGGLGYSDCGTVCGNTGAGDGAQGTGGDKPSCNDVGASSPVVQSTGPTNGFWRAADWLLCRDGKWRPVEPGTFPLAHGAPARVGRLRAYGNAINAEAARIFIESVM